MSPQPRVFVASSKEAKRLAQAVQQNLQEDADTTVWTQDVFTVGRTTIDELSRALEQSDFGVFILAPDDLVSIRGHKEQAARDNVILELGMFIGRLGKERSFFVMPEGSMRLPTDLLGITPATYDGKRAARGEPVQALGAACTQISDAIAREHKRKSREFDGLITEALHTICRAMSNPVTPQDAGLRAFIFREEDEWLVCRHFWDPYQSMEAKGKTRFHIDDETAKEIVVVRCFLENAMSRTKSSNKVEGSSVRRLPKNFEGTKGKFKQTLTYVLAAPIRNKNDKVIGVVDFDASKGIGERLLQKEEASDAVMLRLASHLSSILAG